MECRPLTISTLSWQWTQSTDRNYHLWNLLPIPRVCLNWRKRVIDKKKIVLFSHFFVFRMQEKWYWWKIAFSYMSLQNPSYKVFLQFLTKKVRKHRKKHSHLYFLNLICMCSYDLALHSNFFFQGTTFFNNLYYELVLT